MSEKKTSTMKQETDKVGLMMKLFNTYTHEELARIPELLQREALEKAKRDHNND